MLMVSGNEVRYGNINFLKKKCEKRIVTQPLCMFGISYQKDQKIKRETKKKMWEYYS